tara:strand:+ start:207 stop:404 length:198 start_codon:yes stop_codon:yes gene_type:complete
VRVQARHFFLIFIGFFTLFFGFQEFLPDPRRPRGAHHTVNSQLKKKRTEVGSEGAIEDGEGEEHE